MFVLCPYILCAYLPRSFICLITACISACPSLTGLHAPIRPNITHSWGVASVALSVQCVTLMPGILEVYCTPYVNPPTDPDRLARRGTLCKTYATSCAHNCQKQGSATNAAQHHLTVRPHILMYSPLRSLTLRSLSGMPSISLVSMCGGTACHASSTAACSSCKVCSLCL